MTHWLALIGACITLAGTLVLGIELLKTKVDEASKEEYRVDQDKIESIVRGLVVSIGSTLSTQAKFVAGYLKVLEQDLEPLFKPLMEEGGDEALRANLSWGILARHTTIQEFEVAQGELASSMDSERGLLLVRDVQRRTEARFKRQEAIARRMRFLATVGVILVGVGAVAQLLDVLLHP